MAKRVVLFVALLALLGVSACASADDTQTVAADVDASAVPGPPDVGLFEGSVEEEVTRSEQNNNDRTVALGRLCWVARDAGSVVADLLSTVLVSEENPNGQIADPSSVIEQTKSAVASLGDDLGSDEGLPDSARVFWLEVVAAITEADIVMRALPTDAPLLERRVAYDQVAQAFNFEQMPGAGEFLAEARRQPTVCPDI